jgi:carboxylesterase type B
MTLCGHRSTTLRHNWACVRYANHPTGEHRYTKADPVPEDEPHINTDWTELTP